MNKLKHASEMATAGERRAERRPEEAQSEIIRSPEGKPFALCSCGALPAGGNCPVRCTLRSLSEAKRLDALATSELRSASPTEVHLVEALIAAVYEAIPEDNPNGLQGLVAGLASAIRTRRASANHGVTCSDGTGPDEPSDRGFVCAHEYEADRLRAERDELRACMNVGASPKAEYERGFVDGRKAERASDNKSPSHEALLLVVDAAKAMRAEAFGPSRAIRTFDEAVAAMGTSEAPPACSVNGCGAPGFWKHLGRAYCDTHETATPRTAEAQPADDGHPRAESLTECIACGEPATYLEPRCVAHRVGATRRERAEPRCQNAPGAFCGTVGTPCATHATLYTVPELGMGKANGSLREENKQKPAHTCLCGGHSVECVECGRVGHIDAGETGVYCSYCTALLY